MHVTPSSYRTVSTQSLSPSIEGQSAQRHVIFEESTGKYSSPTADDPFRPEEESVESKELEDYELTVLPDYRECKPKIQQAIRDYHDYQYQLKTTKDKQLPPRTYSIQPVLGGGSYGHILRYCCFDSNDQAHHKRSVAYSGVFKSSKKVENDNQIINEKKY